MTRPDDPPTDDLIAQYHEASEQDTRRPADAVREAVLAHARMVSASSHTQAKGHDASHAGPANQSRWKLSLLASVALAALSGLLVLQFDRGTPEEQDAVSGQRSPSVSPAPPSPAAAPAAVPPPAPPAAPPIPPTRTQAEPPRPAPPKAAAPAPQADAGTTRSEAAERRASTVPLAREQAEAPALATAPATSKAIVPPAAAPAPAAPRADDAASVRGAAPVQQQEASTAQKAQENRALQAPRARLVPGSPAAAMALALQEAARTGRITQLDSLLRQGAPLNAPDDAGRTPLALAVIHGQTAAVQRLLAAGANPALVDREGLNPLQHARRLGLSQIAGLIEAAS